MVEDKKEKKPEKIISDLKNGTLMSWENKFGNRRYFLQKDNGDEIYLEDEIAYLTFKLSVKIGESFDKKGFYEEGREEKDIISTLGALVNAYKTGLF